jgi:hypothetical protein
MAEEVSRVAPVVFEQMQGGLHLSQLIDGREEVLDIPEQSVHLRCDEMPDVLIIQVPVELLTRWSRPQVRGC